ncbi:MAG TPA: hypothetical protein VGC37_04420 [Friedmanniella sp.]
MTELISAADAAVLERRRFLRGGALLAAAAGGAVAATAGSVLPASAQPNPTFPSSFTIPVPAERLLDTRNDEGLKAIVGSSSGALDAKNRLKADAWIDVAIATTSDDVDLELVAVHVNLKALASTKGGSLVVSEPGDKPTGTTVTYRKGETVTNSAFVGLGTTGNSYTVRIFATSTSHVVLDLTGAELLFDSSVPDARRTSRTNAARVLKAVHAVER